MAREKNPEARFRGRWRCCLTTMALASLAVAGAKAEDGTPVGGAPGPLLEIRPNEGTSLHLHMAPYEGQHAQVMIPEAMYVVHRQANTPQTAQFDQAREDATPFHQENGWWVDAENNGKAAFTVRARVGGERGERMEIEYTAMNKEPVFWRAAWFRTCVQPPEAFQDPELKRTYVVDTHGQLRCLADLTHHPINFISVRKTGRSTAMLLPPSLWGTDWRYPDLRLAETVIMVESKDGRHTLSTAFGRAYGLETGSRGPCIHSDGMTGEIAAGQGATVRGYVALTPGDAQAALDHYFRALPAMRAP